MSEEFGKLLPDVRVPPPGPESHRLAKELALYESPNVTFISDSFPVFWARAQGANVEDVDGNVYVDMTAAFAVAAAGHAHPSIVEAVCAQAGRLLHGMGDVHPPAVKVELLRRLAEVAPRGLTRSILANSGAEAVEAALKTVAIATGKPKVLAFHGSYHGLTLGALAVSGRDDFRRPFRGQLGRLALFSSFPAAAPDGAGDGARISLDEVEALVDGDPEGAEVGAILVEPIQGRGGDIVPPDDWLPGLRRICDDRGLLLVLDEIYTGFGRTGRWFACEHWNVTPDLLIVGKALTGGMPFAACIGTEQVMRAWPLSTGEALHTSTFLGHPLGCAAALASLRVLEDEKLVERSASEGDYLKKRLEEGIGRHPRVHQIRGRGLMIGVELRNAAGEAAPELVGRIVLESLARGYLVLGGGVESNVLSLSPPLSIERRQTDGFLKMLEGVVAGFA